MKAKRNKVTGEVFTVDARGKVKLYGIGEEAERKALTAVKRANKRKEIEDAYRSLGLVKVKGTVSGRTYWE